MLVFLCIPLLRYVCPLFLQVALRWTPTQTGLFMMIQPATFAVISPFIGKLSSKFDTKPLTLAGLALIVFSIVGLAVAIGDATVWAMGLAVVAFATGDQYNPTSHVLCRLSCNDRLPCRYADLPRPQHQLPAERGT